MPTAYNTCIKCCVIKLFFNLLFFGGVGSLTKQDGTIKSASAVHSGYCCLLCARTILPSHFPTGDWQWSRPPLPDAFISSQSFGVGIEYPDSSHLSTPGSGG